MHLVSSQTMAAKNCKHVHVVGSAYKQALTGTLVLRFRSANFLPMQENYSEFPRIQFF